MSSAGVISGTPKKATTTNFTVEVQAGASNHNQGSFNQGEVIEVMNHLNRRVLRPSGAPWPNTKRTTGESEPPVVLPRPLHVPAI